MPLGDQRGIALIAAIFLLVVVAFVGVVFVSISSDSAAQSVNETFSNQAFYLASAGIESARAYLAIPGNVCSNINGLAQFTNASLGSGQFTVTASTIGGNCTLNSTGGVPNLSSGTVQRVISYVALTSIQDAWAVGYNDPNYDRPFLAHWNGTAWTNYTSTMAPNIGGNNLMEVSASSSTDIWAVSNKGHMLHYNGTAWSLSQSLAGSPPLNSVYMNAFNDGWAVGGTGTNSGTIFRYNGTNWSAYNPGYTIPNTLQGVYCMNASYCFAVGNRNGGTNNINLWNGTKWTLMPTSGANASFRYVSCVDTTDCWAVGSSGGEIIYWNGTTWTLQDNNNPSLWGVDCVDISHCWAVGYVLNGGKQANYWNLGVWALYSPPTTQRLTFVSCVTVSDCWASGYSGVLIHWSGGTNWGSPVTLVNGASSAQVNSITQFRSGNSQTSWQEIYQ